MINKLFVGMIRTTLEAYVDEIVVKYVKNDHYTRDLEKTFECMCRH